MLSLLKDSYYLKILLLAVLLRILVMPFLFHPDIKVYNFQSSYLQKGVFNIYKFLHDERLNLPLKEEFVYFPLTYFLTGGYQWIVSPILGSDFYNWIQNKPAQEGGYPVFRYLFILKLPILFFDILIAFLLTKFIDGVRKKQIFALWLLNPISIIILYVFSNVDIYPVASVILSLLLIKNKKVIPAAILLGIGASFKVFPLILLPFMILYLKNFNDRVKMLLFGLGSFILLTLPFLFTESFRSSALASGLTTRLLILNINLGFGESLLIGVGVISALVISAFLKDKLSFDNLMKYSYCIFLLILSFVHFHIQWLLWVLPGLVYISLSNKKAATLGWIVLIIGASIPLLYEDRFMSVSLYSLINNNFNLLPIPFGVLSKVYDPYIIQSGLHTIFATSSLYLTFYLNRGDT